MTNISFPENIAPSSRSFKAGEYPQAVFEAQNGAKTIMRYGKNRVNATLTLDSNFIMVSKYHFKNLPSLKIFNSGMLPKRI